MEEHASDATVLTDQNFEAEVLQFPGVTLVDFWAPWCGPCHMMEPRVDELRLKYLDNKMVKVAKMNVDENQQVPMTYSVLSIPNFKFFAGGQLVGEVVGAVPIQKLEETLTQALVALPKPA